MGGAADRISFHKKGLLHKTLCSSPLGGLSQCWALEPTRSGRTRIRNVLADKYIDLVGMNTANGAQAQIWNYVAGGNQEGTLERIDPDKCA